VARALSAVGVVVLVCGITAPVWSSGGVSSGPIIPNWTTGFPLQQLVGVTPAHTHIDIFQTALASNVISPPIQISRLKDVTPETERPRIEQLLATTTWFNGKLATEAEVAHSHSGASGLTPSIMGNTRTDASARMFRLGLTGSEGSLRYGLTFRHAGQGFLLTPDRASREVWSEWTTGWVTVRNAVGQTWNNVEGEATRARMEQTYGRVGLLVRMPSWPELSLTYSRNSLNSLFEPVGVAPQRSANHSMEGAVAVQRSSWDLRFASSYILASDLLRGEADSNIRAQTLSAILRPLSTLTITPILTYRQEFQPLSGVRIETPTASLVLSYQQSPKLQFRAMGNYASARSSDGLINNENLRWKGILDWVWHTSAEWTTKIGFEAGYNRSTNRAARFDTEDISGLLRLSVAPH
jgi:hypothetical protein